MTFEGMAYIADASELQAADAETVERYISQLQNERDRLKGRMENIEAEIQTARCVLDGS